ncbi:unnamed protein product [Rotaria magnacalcarata]|uniref:MULE transposase domain-containing protein n=3 Tax=Rotaria magnacalcarata TaxID=392030 RepID=A0A8S2JBC4_9BILA|nr:unnamed protein product [Rotaria magnacalcarata]CAF3803572.1 unnamed protein product [Rotaria magnacalcarata]
MALTNAQKQKRYRENLKAVDLYHAMKAKHAERMRIYRQSLTGQTKQDCDKRHAESQRTYRNKNKVSKNGFSTRQSFRKAMKKAKRALSKDLNTKIMVVRALAQAVGIVPQNDYQRTTRQLSSNIKSNVISFYCRDDILCQMPGKRDTIVVNHDRNKTTYQKRILLYKIPEAYELFLTEHPVYANANGSQCSNLHSFTSILVCDESNYDSGGQGCESDLSQLNGPLETVVDNLGTIYVTDRSNHRIMRWSKGSTRSTVITGGNGSGPQSNQLSYPYFLFIDRQDINNVYICGGKCEHEHTAAPELIEVQQTRQQIKQRVLNELTLIGAVYDVEMSKTCMSSTAIAIFPTIDKTYQGFASNRRKAAPCACGFLITSRKGMNFSPAVIMSDFESALVSAVKSEFPSSQHKCCFFHFCQAIYRQMQTLGLQQYYGSDETFRLLCRKIMALALMPLDKVLNGLEGIKNSAQNLFNSEMSKLLEYFEKNWLSNIELWNLFGFDSRANNACEGYHNRVSSRLHRRHPNIWQLINFMKMEEKRVENIRFQWSAGASRIKNKRTVALQKRIDTLYKRYSDYLINASDLLHGLSFIVAKKNDLRKRNYINISQ